MLASSLRGGASFPKNPLEQKGWNRQYQRFLLYGYVFPNFLFYYKALRTNYLLSSRRIEGKLEHIQIKHNGDLDSSTICVCVNDVHMKHAKIKANFSSIFYQKIAEMSKMHFKKSFYLENQQIQS